MLKLIRKEAVRMGVLFFILFFFGCSHAPSKDLSVLHNQLYQKDETIKKLEMSNNDKDQMIKQYKTQLKEQARLESEAKDMHQPLAKAPVEAQLFPPDAKAGQCFARVFIPPVYKTFTEQVLKRGESESIVMIPAKYEWVEEHVLVKEASSRLEEIPAKYDTVEEKVLVRPAETVWKKGHGLIEKIDITGEIMCRVEKPAVYKTVQKRVMVKAPSTRMVEIPASYEVVKVKKMVSPPKEQRTLIPAEYQTITRTELVEDGKMEWRPVLCETNMSSDLISRLQTALLKAGHDPGSIDGIIGQHTNAAIKSFQEEKGIAVGGLTFETMESLGIQPVK